MRRLLDLLSSLRLAIGLLLALALASAVGTLVPQNAPPEQYHRLYGPGLRKLIFALGLQDVYASWWFVLLMALLGGSVLCCSLRRLPATWRAVRRAPRGPGSLPLRREARVSASPQEAARRLREALGPPRWEGEGWLAWQWGAMRRLSPHLVHLSFLVILAGAAVTALCGFKGELYLRPGQVASAVRSNRGLRPLGFSLRCEGFRMERYPDGTPKDYRTRVSVLEGGRVVRRAVIRVNHPLRHRGITFYQASYDVQRVAHLELFRGGRRVRSLRVPVGQGVRVGRMGVMVLEYRPDLMGLGEAVRLAVTEEGRLRDDFWVLRRYPLFDARHRAEAPVHFVLRGVERSYVTGLSVSRDPGVWLVYVGCALIMVGLLGVLMVAHRRACAQLIPQPEGCRAVLGATDEELLGQLVGALGEGR